MVTAEVNKVMLLLYDIEEPLASEVCSAEFVLMTERQEDAVNKDRRQRLTHLLLPVEF